MVAVETSRTLTGRLAAEAFGSDLEQDGKRHWRFSGDCTDPVEMRLAGRPDKVLVGLGIEPDRSVVGYAHVRCRKCDKCLEHRRRLWTARSIAEMRCSTRTWFGTLTVGPEHRVRALYLAQLKARRGEVDWTSLDEKERFGRVCAVLQPEVTRYLKRVRKNAKARFRYLLVTEAHKDGFPHFHVLLHEWNDPVRKVVLDGAWKLGFSQWRLSDRDPKQVTYVCKYLAKSALARIRASQEYGQACFAYATEQLVAASETLAEGHATFSKLR